ncbi:MAG: deoxyribose-phosphate aldolase [Coriobacteriales bacterium]|nr:deoxyribose-phosphate aldolase [Coriobacteriales bacterium]
MIGSNIAHLIDHTLLKPEATAADVERFCAEALQHHFAAVCVNSRFIPLVAARLEGSLVAPCAVVGFPLGACSTAAKVAEAGQAVADGARELDMVMAIGSALAGDWADVEADIAAVVAAANSACRGTSAAYSAATSSAAAAASASTSTPAAAASTSTSTPAAYSATTSSAAAAASASTSTPAAAASVDRPGVLVKVIIECCLLSDEQKVQACKAAAGAGAAFVKTSTGFASGGATVADVHLLRSTVGKAMGVKASGGIRTPADAQAMLGAGANRIGTSNGVALLQTIPDSYPAPDAATLIR